MKKRGAVIRKSRHRADPPIVRSVTDTGNETALRIAVNALSDGTGTAQSLDVILTHLHLLQFGADKRNDAQANLVCDIAGLALESVLNRYRNTGKVVATGEERKAVEMLMDESLDFWKRSSGLARDACVQAVNHWYAEIEKSREAA